MTTPRHTRARKTESHSHDDYADYKPSGPPPHRQPMVLLSQFDAKIPEALEPVVAKYRQLLDQLKGHSFGLLEANQAVASKILAQLNSMNYRVRCPRCGEPATLRCSRTNGSANGSFQFEHYLGGGRRTRHGGSTVLPGLDLVPSPHGAPDARRRVRDLAGWINDIDVRLKPELEKALNDDLGGQNPETAEAKEQVAHQVRSLLNDIGCALEFNDRPCSLYVLPASDKNPRGRFQVMPKGSNRPIITRANLADLLPLKLVEIHESDEADDG